MQIPDKIKVGGFTYTVEITDNLETGSESIGEISYKKLAIRLRPLVKGRMEQSLVHEIVHAVFDNLGKQGQDEEEVDRLAGAFYALIVDNPEMW